jgi:DNA polymerase III epsilon subunit family exonuclease
MNSSPMNSFLVSEEFVKLETEYPFLRRAREQVFGLKALSYVIVDIETTGLEPAGNEVTEIAALRVERGEIKDVFSALIKIDRPLPPEIIQLTGITDELLAEEGQDKGTVLRRFLEFAGSTPLLAHNVEFDVPFLNHHLKEGIAKELKNPLLCTLKVSRKLLPGLQNHKLATVAGYYKIPALHAHRAAADVEITYQLWLKLIEGLEKHEINTLEKLLTFTA